MLRNIAGPLKLLHGKPSIVQSPEIPVSSLQNLRENLLATSEIRLGDDSYLKEGLEEARLAMADDAPEKLIDVFEQYVDMEEDEDIQAVRENEVLDKIEHNFAEMEVDIEGSDDDSIVPADEKIAPKDLRRIQQLLKKLKFWGKIVIHYARGYLMF